MNKSAIVFSVFSVAITACSPRVFNLSLEPQMLQNGEVIYRYSDVSGPMRPDDTETENKRVRYMNEWMTNSGNCKNGFDVVNRISVSTNTTVEAHRVFYFIKCK